MKPSRFQDHLNHVHPDQKHKNVVFFQELKENYNSQSTVLNNFSMAAKQDDDGL